MVAEVERPGGRSPGAVVGGDDNEGVAMRDVLQWGYVTAASATPDSLQKQHWLAADATH
jgi:hypothetical protein